MKINNMKNKNKYREEIKEELKNNSIVLSFALSIIIIGIFSTFFKANNALLIGIAISSLLLTLIQCFSNGNTMLNILPIFTLLIFGFFQNSLENIPGINVLLKDNFRNLIIFIAFSLTFLTQAYKNVVFKHALKRQLLESNQEKNKLIYSQLEIIKNVSQKTLKIKKTAEEKGLYDITFNKAIDDLKGYVEEETFVSNVKSSLLIRGTETKKSTFKIEEIEESIVLNSGLGRQRTVTANEFINFATSRDKEEEKEEETEE